MKKKKLALLVIAAAMLLNTVPCYASASAAAVKVSVSSSDKTEGYTSLPTADTLKKDVGFAPKLIEKFAEGYLFKNGTITELYDVDSNGSITNAHKGISFAYQKTLNDVNQTVSLSAEPVGSGSLSDGATVTKYGEVELYYSDRQANSVAWVDHEIRYILMDIDKEVTKEELLSMAKELIDLKPEA